MTTSVSEARPVVVIQWNPKSGTGRGRGELLQLAKALRGHGFLVRMFSRRPKLDAYVRERCMTQGDTARPVRQLRCLVAAGGDGTVADIANRHPGYPIAILPLGTENLLARYLGLSRSGKRLAELVAKGQQRWLDTAVAGDRRFLLMISSGVDAEIVDAMHTARTGNIHRIAYAWPMFRAFLKSQPRLYRAVSSDGTRQISGSHLIVTNVPRYGFGLPFAPHASPDDGLLDVRAFKGTTRWSIFWHALKLKLGLPMGSAEVERFETDAVTITREDSSGLSQVDGDPGPNLPVLVFVQPRSLCVITR